MHIFNLDSSVDRPLPINLSGLSTVQITVMAKNELQEPCPCQNKVGCHNGNQSGIAVGQAFGKKVFSFQMIKSGLTDFLSGRHLLVKGGGF